MTTLLPLDGFCFVLGRSFSFSPAVSLSFSSLQLSTPAKRASASSQLWSTDRSTTNGGSGFVQDRSQNKGIQPLVHKYQECAAIRWHARRIVRYTRRSAGTGSIIARTRKHARPRCDPRRRRPDLRAFACVSCWRRRWPPRRKPGRSRWTLPRCRDRSSNRWAAPPAAEAAVEAEPPRQIG